MSNDASSVDFQRIQQGFTTYHFQIYLSAAGGDFADALELYQLNIQLCEAMYPCLHIMEMSLRNSIHIVLSAQYGQNWFSGSELVMDDYEQEEIDKTIRKLSSRGRDEPSPDRVISEMTLGFWKSLIEKKSYENSIWKPCCRKIFVAAKAKELDVKKIRPKIKDIHRLRNQVFHHECICLREKYLRNTYETINQLVFWLNPELFTWLRKFDRFRTISIEAFDIVASKRREKPYQT